MRKARRLGHSGLEIAPFCFGGNVFGWTVDEKRSFEILDTFVNSGFNVIDTADVYSGWVQGNQGGESETIIGKWLHERGRRDRVLISSKFGMSMGAGKSGLSRTYMRSAIEDSLRRLQTDYIDLYQAHADDQNTPMEETLRGFAELIDEGKVRVIGASNFTAPRLSEALHLSNELGLPRYESLQPIYNLYDRSDFESGLAGVVKDEQVGVISYYTLAQGFLTGKYRPDSDHSAQPRSGRVGPRYMNERGIRILAGLDAVAEKTGASQAQIAIAWVLSNPEITAPIVSATSVAQLAEIVSAIDLDLDEASLKTLAAASA